MAEELTPDICVVGGGPGGVAAARAAAAQGAPVVLVERARMGGANLTRGAIPTQALIAAAAVNEGLRRGPTLGVTGAPLQVNLGKVRDHVSAVCEAVAANLSAERLTALGVKIVAAAARFTDHRTIAAGELTIRARRFILAVGSAPVAPDVPGLDGVETMTAEGVFDLSRKSSHLIVLGATRHGFELAQAYARLGIDATIIDPGPALPEDDPELAAIVVDRLRAEGIRVRTDAKIQSITRRRGGIRFLLGDPGDGDTAVDGSHLLVAAGRGPAVAGLDLGAAGVAHDTDGIVVDRMLRTTNRRVYAIGDAIAGPARAARAEYEAGHVVRSILWRSPRRYDPAAVPVVTYTDPSLATVGLVEADARRRYEVVRVLSFPFIENDRAQAERLPQGVIKAVATRRGRILGASIVGHDAGELIGLWSLAIANRLSIGAMRSFPAPYPTRSDIARRIAATFDGPDLTPSWRRRIIALFRKFG